jgi:hypothetical protein
MSRMRGAFHSGVSGLNVFLVVQLAGNDDQGVDLEHQRVDGQLLEKVGGFVREGGFAGFDEVAADLPVDAHRRRRPTMNRRIAHHTSPVRIVPPYLGDLLAVALHVRPHIPGEIPAGLPLNRHLIG